MQLRTILLAAAVLVPMTVEVAPARADDAPVAIHAGVLRLGAPVVDAQKRSVKLSAALKAIGVSQSPPQTLDVRLTPMASRAPGGAAITRAGTIVFQGPEAGEPDGSYALMRGGGAVAIASVEMRVPTESGKLYVVDCRVRAPQGAATKFTLTRGTTTSLVSVDDGHIYGAFTAASASSAIVVGATPGPGDTSGVLGYFYGCDIGKAG